MPKFVDVIGKLKDDSPFACRAYQCDTRQDFALAFTDAACVNHDKDRVTVNVALGELIPRDIYAESPSRVHGYLEEIVTVYRDRDVALVATYLVHLRKRGVA